MFIVNLTYIKPLEEVEKHLQQHIIFLEQHYKKAILSRLVEKIQEPVVLFSQKQTIKN